MLVTFQHRNTSDNNPDLAFKFTAANEAIIAEIVKRYPPQYKKAAVMPLLDLGQRQHGFTSIAVMNEVARILDMPPMRSIRGGVLLYYVQPDTGREIPRTGVHNGMKTTWQS